MTEQTHVKSSYNLPSVPALAFQALLRVGSLVDLRTTKNGKTVASVSAVATQRYLKAGTTDDWQDISCWYTLELWGDAATRLSQKGINKGDVILATMSSAKLRAEGYVAKGTEGEVRGSLKASCDSIKLIARKLGENDVPVNEPEFVSGAPEEELPF